MAVFPAVYFSFSTRYPESGRRIALSNSYTFTAGPTAPDQRLFMVKLQGMQYFLTGGGALDLSTEQGRNLGFFESFYIAHKLHVSFVFPHPVYGSLNCKFNRPLEIGEGIPGGNGVYDSIEVELIEQP